MMMCPRLAHQTLLVMITMTSPRLIDGNPEVLENHGFYGFSSRCVVLVSHDSLVWLSDLSGDDFDLPWFISMGLFSRS